jgi:parvulin-like peptidyl-prolyl isomerase
MKLPEFARVLALSGLATCAFTQYAVAQQAAPATRPAPAAAAPAPESNVPPDTVVLTIGDQKLTRAQFDILLSALAQNGRPAASPAQKRQVAEQYAELETMAQEARKRKLEDSPEVKQMMAIQADSFLANSLAKKISDDTHFTELDLRSYYNEHKSEFEEAEGKHILIRFKGSGVPLKPNQKDLTVDEALAKAQDIRKQLLAGADFATLAKAESDDAGSGAKGGDLGKFKKGQMVAAFDQAAFSLPVGEISEPVKSQFGYHIIKITARNAKSFEDAKPQIEKDLKPKLTKEAIDQVKAHTAVTMNEAYFGSAPVSGPQTLPMPSPSK